MNVTQLDGMNGQIRMRECRKVTMPFKDLSIKNYSEYFANICIKYT